MIVTDSDTDPDGYQWCPFCLAMLEPAGYEHTLVCPNCGLEYKGDQPDDLAEVPA